MNCFSFISVNKLKNSEVVNDENTLANKTLTTKDSKWMLDLLRKNEKFLSY